MCESKDLLGQLKDNRAYNDKTIFLNKELFKSSFGRFFSTLAHEMSHVLVKMAKRIFRCPNSFIRTSSFEKQSHRTIF